MSMTVQKAGAKGEAGKSTKAKKNGRSLSGLYEISGETIKRKNKTCPKCGPGMFMGKHKDRVVCGKCSYVEYLRKE